MAQGGDEVKTSYPLGIMRVNDAITEEQHRAGCRYAYLFAVLYRKPTVTALSYDGVERGVPGETSPEHAKWLRERKEEFDRADMALRAISRHAKEVVDNAAIYERYPRWMLPKTPGMRDVREAALLVRALSALADAFGYTQRRAA